MNEPYALVGEVLTTAGPTWAAVVIRDGKIDALLPEPRSGDLPRKHRDSAGLLCPGFTDLQINGAFGADIGPDPDAIRTEAAGMPPGDYELGGRKVRLEDDAVRLPNGTLAGSALTMDEAVRNAIRFLDVSLAQAVRIAAETPAAALNLDEKGKIAVGCDADFVLLDEEGTVLETIVAGQMVYEREKSGHP